MKRILLKLLVLSVISILVVGASTSYGDSVGARFKKANRAYTAGKMGTALKIASKTLKKYPAHLPSRIIAARALFRMGKFKKAARYFVKVPSSMVTPDMGYEYGLSMYLIGKYKKAINGFSKVSSRSKIKSLANFYSATCYMRIKMWQRALNKFRRAKKIPQHLRSSRRKMMKQAKKQLMLSRRGMLRGPSVVIVPSVPPGYASPYPPGLPPDPGAPQKKKKKKAPPPPPPPPPKAGFSQAITPSLSVEKTNTETDKYGYTKSTGETTETTIKGAYKGQYDMRPRSYGGQPNVSLGLDLSHVDTKSSGNSVTYTATADNPGTVIPVETQSPATTSKVVIIKVSPAGSIPLSKSVSLNAGFVYSESRPQDDPSAKSGKRNPWGTLDIDYDSFAMTFNGSFNENVDAEGNPTSESTTVSASLDKSIKDVNTEFLLQHVIYGVPEENTDPMTQTDISVEGSKSWDTISGSVILAHINYERDKSSGVYGSLSKSKGYASLSKSYDFGLTLKAKGHYATYSGAVASVSDKTQAADEEGAYPSVPVQVTTHNEMSGTISASLSPFDWLSLGAAYSATKNEHKTSNPLLEPYYLSTQPELSTGMTLTASMSTSF